MLTFMDYARPEIFPHASEPLGTGFCIPGPEKHARVFVCSGCTAARARYLRELPNANHVEVAMRFCLEEEQIPWKQGYYAQVYDRGRLWDVEHTFPECENVYPNQTVRAYLKCIGTNTNLAGLFPGLEIEIRQASQKVADARVVQVLTAEQVKRRRMSTVSRD